MHSSASDISALLDADLFHNGWSGSVDPYPGISHREYAMQSLRRSLIKKFHNDEVSPERNDKALSKFLAINEECRTYCPDDTIVDELMCVAIGEAKSFIDRFCHPHGDLLLMSGKIDKGCGFGSGANIGAKTGDPYGKLAISDLTYTDPALLVLFQQAIRGNVTWLQQEQFRSQRYRTREVQGSRLSFVPKSSEITRTICTEPILNMFFQKGIAEVLERRLHGVIGIDFKKQPDKNRWLARIGSETGRFGTIDLSSASDSMSLKLVRDWFPDHMVRWLELTRSKKTMINGAWVDLHMVSSMGNAYTFPLQTIFFTALVVAAYRALDIPIRYPDRKIWTSDGDAEPSLTESTVGNFAVFGDDIIVESKAYNLVTKMLRYCGFTVNHDKSFNEGLFRESCGHDYFDGYNVRGVYIQKLLDDCDYYSAYNRISRWCATHGMYLRNLLEYFSKRVSRRLFVPYHEDDEAGFKVPWNSIPMPLRRHRHFQSWKYTIAKRRPRVLRMPTSDQDSKAIIRLKRVIPDWDYNPSGMLLLFLHGSLRDGLVTLRISGKKIIYRQRLSSCWDWSSDAGLVKGQYREALASLASSTFIG